MALVQSTVVQHKTNESVSKGQPVHTLYDIPSGTQGFIVEKKDEVDHVYGYVVDFLEPLQINKHLKIYRQIFNTLDEVYAAYEPILPDLQV